MDEAHAHTTPILQGEYYRTGEGGGGLRTAVKDTHRLITAERDGETSESEQR